MAVQEGKAKATLNSQLYRSKMNDWKMTMTQAAQGVEKRTFQPLRSWPASPHVRQEDLAKFRAIPSLIK